MQYDERSDGQEIVAKRHQGIEVSLSETRTAGYRWAMTEKGEPILELQSEQTIPNTGAVGGSGHHIWRFRAVNPGEARLTFGYSRPWQKAGKPTRTFTLKIRVES